MYVCGHCGSSFERQLKKGRIHRYCSRQCAGKAKMRTDLGYQLVDMGFSSPCWLFRGKPDGKGYGNITIANIKRGAHRVYYERQYGSLPTGYHIDHLCEVRLCVNPAHLDVVTPGENTARSWQRGRHEAKRGS